jgi:hypothetical protein
MGLGAVVAAAWLLGSCAESPTDVPIPNQRPAVSISAGPIRDSVNVFIATFNWNASDTDGQVARFFFAIDDTTDWIETEAYEITLLFTATNIAGVDSIRFGSIFLERYRFRDAHTFYLKAVDDDEFFSPLAALSFTAQTIAPETQIINPSTRIIVELGTTFTVTWQGTDLDGTENPVGYSYRLVPVQDVLLLPPDEVENVLFDPKSPGDPWSPFEPRTSVRLENLEVPFDYIFGVIALDQAGAVEPRIRTVNEGGPTNVLRIRAREQGGIPVLCVSSSIKTTCFPTADERRKTFQIPANSNVTFTWSANAQRYGGQIAGYSFGIDLIDPNNFDDPGWAPESANLTRTIIRFDLPPGGRTDDHLLYIRAKDDVGTTIIADITLIVVPLSGERDVLYVDDFGPDVRGRADYEDCVPAPTENVNNQQDFPHDQCHDQFLRESIEHGLELIGHPEWVVDRAEPLDPRTGNLSIRPVEIDSTTLDYWVISGPITLETLARYKVVVWNSRSESSTQLWSMNQEGNDNFIAVYIEAGGAVWFQGSGTYTLNRTESSSVGLNPFGFNPPDLIYRFLHIESVFEGPECQNGCFRISGNDGRLQRTHGFEGLYAHPRALAEGWPAGSERFFFRSPPDTQTIFRTERLPFTLVNKGVPACEAMVVPLGLNINPSLATMGGRLDTLYFYLSNGQIQVFPPAPSWMDHGATALRYSGPGQGRVMNFGVPLYFMPSKADSFMMAGMRWLLAE